jgi:antitoxin component of RelBE/YafQ-DinJ toxin-antitoxin module
MRKYNPPTLAIRMDAKDKEALQTIARWMGVSMSEAIRRLVRAQVAQIKQNPPGAADPAK